MLQIELNELLADAYAEFDRRLRAARMRVDLAGLERLHGDPIENEVERQIETEIA